MLISAQFYSWEKVLVLPRNLIKTKRDGVQMRLQQKVTSFSVFIFSYIIEGPWLAEENKLLCARQKSYVCQVSSVCLKLNSTKRLVT